MCTNVVVLAWIAPSIAVLGGRYSKFCRALVVGSVCLLETRKNDDAFVRGQLSSSRPLSSQGLGDCSAEVDRMERVGSLAASILLPSDEVKVRIEELCPHFCIT